MKIGFMLPMFGKLATSKIVVEMAQLAENRGFESVWTNDHVIMPTQIDTPYPYSKSGDYIADPWEPTGSVYKPSLCSWPYREGTPWLFNNSRSI